MLPTAGATLRGEVENAGWSNAPTQVRFRPAAGAAITTYLPAELRAFRLSGGRYFRYETLPLDRAAQTAMMSLTYAAPHQQQPEAFLAEVLVDGPASLLATTVTSVRHYFAQRAGQPTLTLAAEGRVQRLANAGHLSSYLPQPAGV